MSSATQADPAAARALVADASAAHTSATTTDGMTLRQKILARRWAYYRGTQYQDRQVAYDGTQAEGPYHLGQMPLVPPGYTLSGDDTPVRQRKPAAPYELVQLVVQRFTEMLFSEEHRPRIGYEDDPESDDYINTQIERSHFWVTASEARNLAGAQASVAVSFGIIDGETVWEMHDAQHCTPRFLLRRKDELESLEIKYVYEDTDGPAGEDGKPRRYWYRRVIDRTNDMVWPRVPVGDGTEPRWAALTKWVLPHNLGECPVVWTQNLPNHEGVDGTPDIANDVNYDTIDTLNLLTSMAVRGVTANCDPTLLLMTERTFAEIKKGSDNAIGLEKDGNGRYLEITGEGVKRAEELSDKLEARFLRAVQCVIDQARSATTRTATEVDRDYSAMWAKCGKLRKQWASRFIVPLLGKYMRAVRRYHGSMAQQTTVSPDDGSETTQQVQLEVKCSPRLVRDDAGNVVGRVERTPGVGECMIVSWGPYTRPTPADVKMMTDSAAAAKGNGLLPSEDVTRYLAAAYGVENVAAAIARLQKVEEDKAASEREAILATLPPVEAKPVEDTTKRTFQPYEIEDGLVTINEARASKGLPPMPDGDLTLPQYKAVHMDLFQRAATADEPEGGAGPNLFGAQPPTGSAQKEEEDGPDVQVDDEDDADADGLNLSP